MIVCHCNRIPDGEIRRCCLELHALNPNANITAVAVYNGLAKKPRCGGCLKLATGIIQGCLAECSPPAAAACAASLSCPHRCPQNGHAHEHHAPASEHAVLAAEPFRV